MRNKFLGTGEKGYHPIRKITVCISGFNYAMRYDFSVAYKVYLSLLILVLSSFLHQWLDALVILAATGLVLVAEMFNSAIEGLCDFVETKENEKIKVIKDISAAATGITILIWSVVMLAEISNLTKVLLQRYQP